jgi:hypothetical protein
VSPEINKSKPRRIGSFVHQGTIGADTPNVSLPPFVTVFQLLTYNKISLSDERTGILTFFSGRHIAPGLVKIRSISL